MPFQIVPPGTHIDFVGRWRVGVAGSLLFLLACAVALPLRGVRLGVDFAGGYQIAVRLGGQNQAGEGGVRQALARIGASGASVTRLGEPAERLFQVQFLASEDATPDRLVPLLEDELTRSLGPTRVESIDFVGPRVGRELRRSALVSFGIAFALILVYVAVRFTPAYAPGAVVALVHDVLVTAGAFVLFGWEFDLNVVAALLTIVGYSLNDTIVIYDRIRENRALRTAADLPGLINQSVNETLSRTVLTAGTTLLVLLALLAFGGRELRGFSAAMTIGVVVGTYSTIYVASPLALLIERRPQPRASPRAASSSPASGG